MSCRTFTDFIWRVKEQVLKRAVIQKPLCCVQQNQTSRGISLRSKLCYAVGGVPYQMTTAAIAVSLQIFLLDVVQMEAFYVSLILLLSRAWDAVTDPLIGYLVSRSSWTPIGKLPPWLVLSAPFAVLSYVLLWFVPHASMSAALTVLWFLAVTCLFETLMSCFHVPYLSLNMFMGGTKRERDSATAYRMSVEMVAMLVASVIQGQVVAVYNIEKQKNCEELDQAQAAAQSTSSSPTSLQGTKRAFLTSALVIGAMFFLCSLIIFLGVKEQRSPDSPGVKMQMPFLTSMKLLLRFVPYHRLVLGFTITSLAYHISLGNFALFCSHAAGLGPYFQHLLLVLLGSATIAVPIWQVVLLKIGKKSTFFIGIALFIPAVMLVACCPGNLTVFIMMCVVMGFSVATVFLLPWSMLPDVVDEFTMTNPDCTDMEPLFFSCYAFCNKLSGGVAAGVSTMTLQFVGYKSGACNHSDEVVTALLVLFSAVPITLLLLGMLAFLFYPIDERQSSQSPEQIATIDSKGLSSSSDQRAEEILCGAVTGTAPASSDKIQKNERNEATGKFSRGKCAVHRHSADDNENDISETHTDPFPLEPNLKFKVSWV
ncbi:sodium-dependent lysophosphatidylcholine symporter 1-B-like [Eucyclogobius newberryi]|uniref:sodium-dependent lysophosphatidylcholine symporter 1-B-like n=1 Tax=Eucyclogobius newberryi TaxID=166745 RepID=UPI003B59A99E